MINVEMFTNGLIIDFGSLQKIGKYRFQMDVIFLRLSASEKWMEPVVQGGPLQFPPFECSPLCFGQVGNRILGDNIM